MDDQEKKERRKYKRYPFKEDVLIDAATKAYSLNICETGMFVCTLHPFQKGRVLNITFASQFTVKAEVKNYQPGIGMGVEFISLTHDQKRMIKRLIENITLDT